MDALTVYPIICLMMFSFVVFLYLLWVCERAEKKYWRNKTMYYQRMWDKATWDKESENNAPDQNSPDQSV